MEEVDKIIIHTLKSIECKLDDNVGHLSEFNQELFVECVSKLLNTIHPNENLPSKLPPNTGIKYRICTKFANLCQDLGYKSEIGYQTFLYSNELDMRRLLMFLIEKLPKDQGQQDDSASASKTKKGTKEALNVLIAKKLNLMLSQCWTPPYCKQSSLRFIDNDTILKEGCSNIRRFNTVSLAYPVNYAKDKEKYSKDAQEYYEKFCPFVTEQVHNESLDLLSSLMQQNAIGCLEEQNLLKKDLSGKDKKKKQEFMDDLRKKIRDELDKASSANNDANCLTPADVFEIESEFDLKNIKNLKGSRFTHMENLQYNKEDSSNVAVPSSETEEKKEEEIKALKEKLDGLNETFNELDEAFRNINKNIDEIEKECAQQREINKKLEENYALKRKTVNLIEEAPKNLAKLKEEIENFDQKMKLLEQQWLEHKKPLEEEREKLNELAIVKRKEMEEKMNEINQLKEEFKRLSGELAVKDEEIGDLNKSLEASLKETSKTTANRQFYTKRILEIVANIEKQKREIEKTLIETKGIQKEINQLMGKLERIFNETDELVFKDAKKDESTKKAYKLFISINENYEQLIKTIEETSVVAREICDLEDQVNSETQNNVASNMENLIADYKQIKEENEQLMKKIKPAKK